VLRSQERELNMEARMQEKIRRQVALQLSSQRQPSTLEHAINISSPQLRSSCASTELSYQDEALQHFPMDDITMPLTPCELHIPMGNTVPQSWWCMVLFLLWSLRRHQEAMGIQFHLAIIASRWIELSKTIGKCLLTFLEVMGRRP